MNQVFAPILATALSLSVGVGCGDDTSNDNPGDGAGTTDAYDTDAYDTDADDTDADDTDAYDTDAYDTDAYDTDAYDTDAYDTDAYDTDAYDTDAYDTDADDTDADDTDADDTDADDTDDGDPHVDAGDRNESDAGTDEDGGRVTEPVYDLVMLDLTDAQSAEAYAISADGTTVGGAVTLRVDDVLISAGALWVDGEVREDVLPAAGLSASINAFTHDGFPVGWTTDADGFDYPIRYPGRIEDGAWNVLPALDSPLEFGWAIGGANGVVVGTAVDQDWYISEPWVWSDSTTSSLGSFGGESGQVTGINASGDIVGWSQTDDVDSWVSRGFVVPAGGTLEDAVQIDGLGGNTTFARAINSAGWVIGDSALGDGTSNSFLWSESDGIQAIRTPPEGVTYSVTRSINDAGEVVGDNPTAEGPTLGWLWSEAEGSRYLDDLVDLPDGWHVRRAWMIADEGSVLIGVDDDEGNSFPAVLRPL